MKLCVIGSGYVGLVDGACFAETGNNVICVDVDEKKIENLNKGIIPIYEPGLEEIIKRNEEKGRLSFSTEIDNAVKESDICFIAVGTPPDEDGSADLQHVLAAAESIGKAMNGYKIIVDKSTVPVGTADKVRAKIASVTKHEFDVVSNPEFLKEGSAIPDFLKPERIVIGAESEKAFKLMEELYGPYIRTGAPIVKMNTRSAEMTKYAANAILATKISFMNDMANLCELVDADIDMVRKGIGSDSRIGSKFLFPGPGYGGSCFPKDVKAIIKTAKDHKYDLRILQSVEDVNNDQKKVMAEKVLKHFNNDIKGKTFAVWGLAFKAQTDDMREASSIDVVNTLLETGAKVKAHDPEAMDVAKIVFGDKVEFDKDNYAIVKDADGLIIMTEWNDYREPDFEKIKELLNEPVIFDGRNLYNKGKMKELGIIYHSIGR